LEDSDVFEEEGTEELLADVDGYREAPNPGANSFSNSNVWGSFDNISSYGYPASL
jgi:hypothetical protein